MQGPWGALSLYLVQPCPGTLPGAVGHLSWPQVSRGYSRSGAQSGNVALESCRMVLPVTRRAQAGSASCAPTGPPASLQPTNGRKGTGGQRCAPRQCGRFPAGHWCRCRRSARPSSGQSGPYSGEYTVGFQPSPSISGRTGYHTRVSRPAQGSPDVPHMPMYECLDQRGTSPAYHVEC